MNSAWAFSDPAEVTPTLIQIAVHDLTNSPDKCVIPRLLANADMSNLMPNPTSEQDQAGVGNALRSPNDPSNAYAGNYYRRLPLANAVDHALTEDMDCAVGDVYQFDCFAKLSAEGGSFHFAFVWLDVVAMELSRTNSDTIVATTYTALSLLGTTPPGCVAFRLIVAPMVTDQSNYGYFDNMTLRPPSGGGGAAPTVVVNSNTTNLIPNPTSEHEQDGVGGALRSYEPENARTGSYCRRVSLAVANEEHALTDDIDCVPGDSFIFRCQAKVGPGGSGAFFFVLRWIDASGGEISIVTTELVQSTDYSGFSVESTAPAGSVAFRITAKVFVDASGQYGFFDDMTLQPVVTAAVPPVAGECLFASYTLTMGTVGNNQISGAPAGFAGSRAWTEMIVSQYADDVPIGLVAKISPGDLVLLESQEDRESWVIFRIIGVPEIADDQPVTVGVEAIRGDGFAMTEGAAVWMSLLPAPARSQLYDLESCILSATYFDTGVDYYFPVVGVCPWKDNTEGAIGVPGPNRPITIRALTISADVPVLAGSCRVVLFGTNGTVWARLDADNPSSATWTGAYNLGASADLKYFMAVSYDGANPITKVSTTLLYGA